MEVHAKLWLHEFYHSQYILPEDYKKFNTASAQDLLWKMHFLGHEPWENAPFFWIHFAELKRLLGLDLSQSRFSYIQLKYALEENPKTSLAVMRKVLAYHFATEYLAAGNRSRSEQIALPNITEDLWVGLKNNDLTVISTPELKPWSYLKPGEIIAEGVRMHEREYIQKNKKIVQEALALNDALNRFSQIIRGISPSEQNYINYFRELSSQGVKPKELAISLETRYPIEKRLAKAGTTLKVLPSALAPGEWYSLKALKTSSYDAKIKKLIPVGNFTLYSDERFESIRSLYLELERAVQGAQNDVIGIAEKLADQLDQAYEELEGRPYRKAFGKELRYPTFMQLKIEDIYTRYPWIEACIALYGLALMIFLISWKNNRGFIQAAGFACMVLAFGLHTFLLAMRCYILQRPPVSNMFETAIYVPWVSVLAGFLLRTFIKETVVLMASAAISVALLIILKLSHASNSMENVQAVLDSQYWLTIHVLMVVGSYGAFALAGAFAHLYLLNFFKDKCETPHMLHIGKLILQSMYLGVALLIPGTILGGVWAAESWGRFWDWDPKESWAFISSCVYLLWIHAYRFKYVQYFGLAVGAITGLLAIAFTWYGVNYILGTGLHSYGFGSGGEIYFYLYLIAEILFLAAMLWEQQKLPKKM